MSIRGNRTAHKAEQINININSNIIRIAIKGAGISIMIQCAIIRINLIMFGSPTFGRRPARRWCRRCQ